MSSIGRGEEGCPEDTGTTGSKATCSATGSDRELPSRRKSQKYADNQHGHWCGGSLTPTGPRVSINSTLERNRNGDIVSESHPCCSCLQGPQGAACSQCSPRDWGETAVVDGRLPSSLRQRQPSSLRWEGWRGAPSPKDCVITSSHELQGTPYS